MVGEGGGHDGGGIKPSTYLTSLCLCFVSIVMRCDVMVVVVGVVC